MNANKTIVLARHGDASWGPRDYDRPLSERGRADVMNAATFLISKDLEPDLIVYSPARRTRESLEIIKNVCSRRIVARTLEFEPLYQCTVEHILDACCLGDGIQHLMVLAHNPGLTDFLYYLVTDGDVLLKRHGGLTPATMVAVEVAYDCDILVPHKGKVVDWYSP